MLIQDNALHYRPAPLTSSQSDEAPLFYAQLMWQLELNLEQTVQAQGLEEG